MAASTSQQAESDILNYLLKLNRSINESDVKLWKTQAYSKYYKIDTEKFAIENKLIDEQIRTLEGVEETLKQTITSQTQMKDSLLESLKVRERSIVHLKQRQDDANKETAAWCEKLDAEYKKQLGVFHQHRLDLENSSPLYKQLKEAENRTRLLEFEVKMKAKEVRYEREKYKFRKELRAKMFNAAIVQFVKTVQLYHKNRKVEAEAHQCLVEEISVKVVDSTQPEKQEKPIQKNQNPCPLPPLCLPKSTNLSDVFNEQISISLKTIEDQDCGSDACAVNMYKEYLARSKERRLLMQKYDSCEKLDLNRLPKNKKEIANETDSNKRKLPIVLESPKKAKINIIDNQLICTAKKNPEKPQFMDETQRETAEAVLPQKTKKVMFMIDPPIPKLPKTTDVTPAQIDEPQKPPTIVPKEMSRDVDRADTVKVEDKTFVSESVFVTSFNSESKLSPYFARPGIEKQRDVQPKNLELEDEEPTFNCTFEDVQQEMQMSTDQSINFLVPSFLAQENDFQPISHNMSFNLTSSQPSQQSGFTFNFEQNDNDQRQYDNAFSLF